VWERLLIVLIKREFVGVQGTIYLSMFMITVQHQRRCLALAHVSFPLLLVLLLVLLILASLLLLLEGRRLPEASWN
jgi:hypothetical protein